MEKKQPGDREIAELARRQHGRVALWQLLELGFGRGAVEHRLRAGRLHQLYRGVYAVGHDASGAHGRWMAAALAFGQDAVLSHASAAALWAIRPSASGLIDVTVPGRSRHPRPGVRLHLVRRLHPDDVTVRAYIPVTSVPRTLLDLAEVASFRDLGRAVEAAERLRLFDLRAIEKLLQRSRGRHGLKALRAVIANYRPAPMTRSELERAFLEFCIAYGIPLPETNALVEGYEVDALWRAARLIVELDSREFHDTVEAFERDRLRDAELQLAGYTVLRITWRRLSQHPGEVAATLWRGLDSTLHHHGDDRLRRGRTVGMVASRGPR